MAQTLSNLLSQARAAARGSRILLRDEVAAFGAPAIEEVAPWIAEAEYGGFAVRVIQRAGQLLPEPAIAALRSSQSAAATPEILDDIAVALAELNPAGPPTQGRQRQSAAASTTTRRRPTGATRYMRSWNYWHVIDGEVDSASRGRFYLSSCYRWNTEGYINRPGTGVQDRVPDGEHVCDICDRIRTTDPVSQSTWAATLDDRDRRSRMLLRRDRVWHVGAEPGPVDSSELGGVYLTECGWWVESERTRATRTRAASSGTISPICSECLRFLDARQGADGGDEPSNSQIEEPLERSEVEPIL